MNTTVVLAVAAIVVVLGTVGAAIEVAHAAVENLKHNGSVSLSRQGIPHKGNGTPTNNLIVHRQSKP